MSFSLRQAFLLFIFLMTVIMRGGAQKIIRGPYLQLGTPTSIVIRWRTDAAGNSKVTFGLTADQRNRSVVDEAVTTEHEVKLFDLQPNTFYYYSLGTTGEVQGSGNDYYFKTAGPAGSKQKVRIWVMGDMGSGSPNQVSVRDSYMTGIKNNNRATDLVLLLGDNAYGTGTDEEYQNNFFNVYQNHFLRNNVLWAIPGNHEYYSGAQTKREVPFFKIFSFPQKGEAGGVASGSKMYYSFDYANVHFVGLDSYGIEDEKYRLYDTLGPQVQWLTKDLAANKQPWTIVMFHHPPYTKNSHDSDAESELIQMRKNLTPILERFKVDLVLSGHSHLYERSRPMRGHTGSADTFDADIHLLSTSSGRYDGSPNSCAYIKNPSTEGVIYTVVGSSGQNNGFNGVPHPAMPFKNATVGGSAYIDVEDNRLDFNWLGADQIVHDQFTIFKNVNKTTDVKARLGETVTLTPSWKGSCRWPDGSRTSTKEFTIVSDTVLFVRDSPGCLQDRFNIEVFPRPQITTQNLASVCSGASLSVPFSVTNTEAAKWTYTAQLSDAQGSFTSPVSLGSGSGTPLTANIPSNLPAGEGYKIRVIANAKGFEYTASAGFSIRQKATATLKGDATIDVGKTAALTLMFTGAAPWTYRLSDNTGGTTSANPLTLTVNPLKTTVYSLTEITNACGAGSPAGSVRVAVIPRIETALPASVVVCNGTDVNVPFTQVGEFETAVNYVTQLSSKEGDFLAPTFIGSGSQSPLKATVPLSVPIGSGYRIRIVVENNATVNSTPSGVFTIRQRASATISGDTAIRLEERAPLTLRFEGTSPRTYVLSDNSTNTTGDSPYVVTVTPTIPTVYTLKSVSNVCGVGSVNGSALVKVLITGTLQEEESKIRIFPNPAQTKVKVEVNALQSRALSWVLMNIDGQVVKEGNGRKNQRSNFEIDVVELPSGTYVLRIALEEQTFVRKLVKL
ncbi:metallophosphoesterase [Runella slithyformis]|uniref:Metallophosphoesterase n=1 Tax=Runella slithyformis (strain ATCC 29530 / DSM 19594 / LMG 11500 / NCIMB 11436 / LSU 4) TaxID=761193 RepID=A0A7U3ZJT2_RUNSL|nr:metallophosphoesterase [Runella slithyformis]AEI48507.1 metallophosphoesterase [Runella slithyformis DSM 19594]